jgi:hypothetical protein
VCLGVGVCVCVGVGVGGGGGGPGRGPPNKQWWRYQQHGEWYEGRWDVWCDRGSNHGRQREEGGKGGGGVSHLFNVRDIAGS